MHIRQIRRYLADVYPMGRFLASASGRQGTSDAEALRLFRSRHWFYTGRDVAPLDERLLSQLSLIRPPQHECVDGFFGSGLLQRDAASRFPQILPCTPGTDCVRKQAAHVPRCAAELAARAEDVWAEVWHLAHDGRQMPRHRRVGLWSELIDHGQAGWWYIHAPGSGIFYHAGRTLAASSKAGMLAAMLEEWASTPEAQPPPPSSQHGGGGSKGKRNGGGRGGRGGSGGGSSPGEGRRLRRAVPLDSSSLRFIRR